MENSDVLELYLYGEGVYLPHQVDPFILQAIEESSASAVCATAV